MTTRCFIAPLRSLAFLLSALPLLTACPAAGDEDDEIGEVGDTDSTDSSDSSDSSDSTESDDNTTESDDSTDTDSTSSDETGDVDADTALCQDYCDAWYPCTSDQPQDGTCVADCLADLHANPVGVCAEGGATLLACLATLTCEEHEAYLWHEEGEAFPCDTEQAASCECLYPLAEITEGQTGSDCSLGYTCNEQIAFSVECDGEGCTCYQNGVETGGCVDAMTTCQDLVETGDYETINACCGWSLD
jgi:hypothetical protein